MNLFVLLLIAVLTAGIAIVIWANISYWRMTPEQRAAADEYADRERASWQ